ncbi:uncharacterized protein LOC111703537 isoform X2 [Eurytemora carolleeae]|uniref:uncharacterized protein LOC111703537 isoform X2 n=1 Tax=Eurytemora carolleeae TaxID=1294199 RepID=UPI000C76C2EB|nr:uncharacterized protein LOC111703537 isoform X2 [Eurytemora carolleeae]|eukprot:XP_023331264.1 uncharacterized protein LOC111703537 isoform X2 [Eurytemora affinis]
MLYQCIMLLGISLGVLMMKIQPVISECSKKEEQHSCNTMQWFIRKEQSFNKCLTIYVGIEIAEKCHASDQVLVIKDGNKLESLQKTTLNLPYCVFLITNKAEVVDNVPQLGFIPTLTIIFQDHNQPHKHKLGISSLLILSTYSNKLTYWDMHKQCFEGVWSTYYSTVWFNSTKKNTEINSFQKQKIRVGYNNFYPKFEYKHNRINVTTYEGYYLQTYLEKYQLHPVFDYANFSWGNLNTTTGKWNGVVGMVGYDKADLGVCYISYTRDRAAFVTYTSQIEVEATHFVSKFPGIKSYMDNIVKVFDVYTWLAILGSLILATIVLLAITKVLKELGFKQPDCVLTLLMPLSLLNAEGMPDCFLFRRKRVFSGSFLLMTWALACTLLTFAFSSNLRSILLAPSYDIPVDTSAQIVERRMSLILAPGENWNYEYFSTSSNLAQVKMLENIVFIKDVEDSMRASYQQKSLIFLGHEEVILGLTKNNPEYPENKPSFYFSKELIRPYYYGWIVEKNSKWMAHINRHILLGQQVRLNFEHMAAAYILLGVGLGISSIGKMDSLKFSAIFYLFETFSYSVF